MAVYNKIWTSGVNVMKHIFFIANCWAKKARMFFTGEIFRLVLHFLVRQHPTQVEQYAISGFRAYPQILDKPEKTFKYQTL